MCSPAMPSAPAAPAPTAAPSTGADATTLAQQQRQQRVQAAGLGATIVAGDTLGGGGTSDAKKTGATVLGG